MPNHTPPEVERRIPQTTEQYPTYSYVCVANQLKLVGIGASPTAVRCVWQRQSGDPVLASALARASEC